MGSSATEVYKRISTQIASKYDKPCLQQENTLAEMQMKLITFEISHQMRQGSCSLIHHPPGPFNLDLPYTEARVSNQWL